MLTALRNSVSVEQIVMWLISLNFCVFSFNSRIVSKANFAARAPNVNGFLFLWGITREVLLCGEPFWK
jgi:hypothetical protein